jgi:uncharacterized membrane protein
MSYLAGGYIILRLLNVFKKKIIKIFLAIPISLILGSLFVYPKLAVNSYYRDLRVYQGLDGETWLAKQNPDIYDAIVWIRKNIGKSEVVLEAPGDSYTEKNVISSYTGNTTVSGWFVHEWLWRGDSIFPQKRVDDITIIYTSQDIEVTKSYLKTYGVDYVIIGPNEFERFPGLNENKFYDLGKMVFSNATIKIFSLGS